MQYSQFSAAVGFPEAPGFWLILSHDCQGSWVRENAEYAYSLGKGSHFVRVGNGRWLA